MRSILARYLRENDNCIDIGAASGDFLAELYRYAPRGNHIAYEALADLAAILRDRFPRATVRQVAVSDSPGSTTFARVENSPGWSGLRPYEFQIGEPAVVTEVNVQSVRLDDDLPPDYIPALVKIDVNGAEESVIRGALRTFHTHRPLVLLEHGLAAQAYGTTAETIHSLLTKECGLQIFKLDGFGPLSAEQLADATEWNFLARPVK